MFDVEKISVTACLPFEKLGQKKKEDKLPVY
jgi:hypothetical protein